MLGVSLTKSYFGKLYLYTSCMDRFVRYGKKWARDVSKVSLYSGIAAGILLLKEVLQSSTASGIRGGSPWALSSAPILYRLVLSC